MKRICNTVFVSAWIIVLGLCLASTGLTFSLDSGGTYYKFLQLDPPTELALTLKGNERHYTVKGSAVLEEGNDTEALGNIYFTYKTECVFDTETKVMKEHTRFLRMGSAGLATAYTLYATIKCSTDPWIAPSASLAVQSFSGSLFDEIGLGSIKPQLPFGSKVLSSGQRQTFLNQIVREAKTLEILSPKINHVYPAAHEVLILVRQNIPSDIAESVLERGTQAMIDLVNVHDPKDRVSKIIPLMATGIGLKTFTLPRGRWKVRAYVYSPYVGDIASAEWRKFWVEPSASLDISDYAILLPSQNQLVSGDLQLRISFPPNTTTYQVRLTINWIPPTKPGQWPEPPDHVFKRNYGNLPGDISFETTIKKSKFFDAHKDGRYQLIVEIHLPPYGFNQPDRFITLKREIYAGDMANLIHHVPQLHVTKAMSWKPVPMHALGLKTSYTAPARIFVKVKHPVGEQVEYQLQRKSFNGKSFKPISPSNLKKRAVKSLTTWTLTLKKPGIWRIRFKPKRGKRWGKWHQFKVKEVRRTVSSHAKPAGDNKPKIHFPAPAIELPKQNKVFQARSKIPVRISFRGSVAPVFQFQYKDSSKSLYKKKEIPVRGLKVSGGIATGTFVISEAGFWRMRVKGDQWSAWRAFRVNTLSRKQRKISPEPRLTIKPKHTFKPKIK